MSVRLSGVRIMEAPTYKSSLEAVKPPRSRPAMGLHAAQVHHNGGFGDILRVVPDPLYGRAGADGNQNQIARPQVFLRQGAVHGPAHPGQGHGLLVQVRAPDGVGRPGLDALRHGPADEAQAHNADIHSILPIHMVSAASARISSGLHRA